MPLERPIISVRQAAEILGVTESTAYRWLDRGELPGAVRLGGRWYVRRAALVRFCEGEDDAPTPDQPRLRAVG